MNLKKSLQAVLILSATALGLSVAMAQTSVSQTATGNVNITLDQSELAWNRALIATALSKVGQARAAVHEKASDEAVDNLLEARTLFDLIRAARPVGEITALLNYLRAHLAFEDNQQVLAELLPLYKALDFAPASNSVTLARGYLDAARAALQKPDRAQALKSLDNMEKVLAVENIDLPLQAAQLKLYDVVQMLTVERKLPPDGDLVTIEENLLLALEGLGSESQ